MKNITNNVWGQDLAINLGSCNLETIQSVPRLTSYIEQLCELIEMEAVGRPQFTYLSPTPELAGFTAFQLIQTSSIVIHLCDLPRTAYFNIFSCKRYNSEEALLFTKEFFKAETWVATTIYRNEHGNRIEEHIKGSTLLIET